MRAWICQRRESRTEPEGSSNTGEEVEVEPTNRMVTTSYFSQGDQQLGQPPCLLLSQSSTAMVNCNLLVFSDIPHLIIMIIVIIVGMLIIMIMISDHCHNSGCDDHRYDSVYDDHHENDNRHDSGYDDDHENDNRQNSVNDDE